MQTVLVLGGYGFFGQRIGAALASGPSLRVLLAGRDRSRATAAAHAIGLPPEQAVAIDARDLDLARTLTRLDVVVWSLAGLAKAGILPGMGAFAVPLNRISRWMEPLVSGAGGMFVSLDGQGSDGAPLSITWNLIA